MKRILYLLLFITGTALGQVRLDSARTVGATSVTPQWWTYGNSASSAIIGFRIPTLNKEFSIYSAYQSDLRYAPITGGGYVPNIRLVSTGFGLLGGGNLSSNLTLKADTTSLQTIANFFPKGDTRYYTKSQSNVLLALKADSARLYKTYFPRYGNFFRAADTVLFTGDSFTNPGLAASPSSNRYTTTIANTYGYTETNFGVSGTGLFTATGNVFINEKKWNQTTPLNIMIGYNDIRQFGATAQCLGKISGGIRAIIVNHFLKSAVAASDASVTTTGVWAAGTAGVLKDKASASLGGLPKVSVTAGATMTYISPQSTSVVIGVFNSAATPLDGRASVTIDGIVRDTINNYNKTVAKVGYDGNSNRTQNAAVYLGLSNSAHTVVVTLLDAKAFYVDYFGTLRPPGETKPILIGDIVKMNAAGYAIYLPIVVGDADIDAANASIASVVNEFPGYPVAIAKTNTYYNISTDIDADNIHANNRGHGHIARAFIEQIAKGNVNTTAPPIYTDGQIAVGKADGTLAQTPAFTFRRAIPSVGINIGGANPGRRLEIGGANGQTGIRLRDSSIASFSVFDIGYRSGTFNFDVLTGANTLSFTPLSVTPSTGVPFFPQGFQTATTASGSNIASGSGSTLSGVNTPYIGANGISRVSFSGSVPAVPAVNVDYSGASFGETNVQIFTTGTHGIFATAAFKVPGALPSAGSGTVATKTAVFIDSIEVTPPVGVTENVSLWNQGPSRFDGIFRSKGVALTGNQLWAANAAGTAMEGKNVTGSAGTGQTVTHGVGSIAFSNDTTVLRTVNNSWTKSAADGRYTRLTAANTFTGGQQTFGTGGNETAINGGFIGLSRPDFSIAKPQIAFTDLATSRSLYLEPPTLTATRTLTLPDATGTLAVSETSTQVTSGVVVPVSTPAKIGDMYVDTVLKKIYVATGTASSADWTILN